MRRSDREVRTLNTGQPTISEIGRKYLGLHLSDAVGPVMLGRLIAHFGSVEKLKHASIDSLTQVEGIGPRRAQAVFNTRNTDAIEREVDRAQAVNAHIICWEDDDYPAQLRHCNDPPVCIYVRGQLQQSDAVSIAIVGSRKSSRYGYDQAHRFGALIAGAGFTVVSGMARGIDGYAHEGALSAQGRTVAVLGCGVDVVYPPEHGPLADKIMANGALVSELPIGSQPTAGSFPSRNRIIAGMSLGTLVVEASKRSGALITSRLANEYNREVFAIPGRLDTPTAIGTNALIQSGSAKLVMGLEDILDELGDVGQVMGSVGDKRSEASESETPAIAGLASLSGHEKTIVDLLSKGEMNIDELIGKSNLSASEVSVAITLLRIKSTIVELPGNCFALRRT
ncbi:MAG: DNA processing protein DprA [Phycisphaerae bacterium]|nr:MAG: DNA processing protein DprA [Phycisphaerae bacterium]